MITQSWPPGKAGSPLNRLRGAQNRAAGLGFEDMLKAACVHYALLGEAAIEKNAGTHEGNPAHGQGTL